MDALFVLWLLEFQKYAYVNEAYCCQKSMPTLFEASRNAVVMLLSRWCIWNLSDVVCENRLSMVGLT